MKKLKTLFTVTLVIDILAVAPLFLMMFIPSMKEEMVYSQFPGMMENELAQLLQERDKILQGIEDLKQQVVGGFTFKQESSLSAVRE